MVPGSGTCALRVANLALCIGWGLNTGCKISSEDNPKENIPEVTAPKVEGPCSFRFEEEPSAARLAAHSKASLAQTSLLQICGFSKEQSLYEIPYDGICRRSFIKEVQDGTRKLLYLPSICTSTKADIFLCALDFDFSCTILSSRTTQFSARKYYRY